MGRFKMSKIVDLRKESEFDKMIRKYEKYPVILQFYTNTIGDSLAKAGVNIDILRVNVSKFPSLAMQYKVEQIPTVIGLDHGNQHANNRLVGSSTQNEIKNFVNVLINFASSTDKLYRGNSVSGYSVEPSLTDDFPQPNQLQTYKQYIFTNDSIALKPISVIPGIGQVYSERMRNHDIIYARQLVGIYMQIGNIPKFQHWLKEKFGMNERWSITTAEALAEVVRHLC
ncbi:hypothetical protein GJ496_001544 [Pomphorhynchus laevis]|nr:hypothetical protein GJ496_001544 [Pomphorhynchus laevis]